MFSNKKAVAGLPTFALQRYKVPGNVGSIMSCISRGRGAHPSSASILASSAVMPCLLLGLMADNAAAAVEAGHTLYYD